MKAYVLAIAGMAILTAVVTLVMPRKKFSGTIGWILKLCMILTLVGPILGFIRQDPTEFSSAESIFTQDGAYINNSYALAVERELKSRYGVTVRAEVSLAAAGGETGGASVKIYIDDFGMNAEEEHINIITQIAETVGKLLETDDVEVYDGTR